MSSFTLLDRHATDMLKRADIKVNDRTHLYFPASDSVDTMILEGPSIMGYGHYKIDFFGAFSYVGMIDASTVAIHTEAIGRFCATASGVSCGAPEHPTGFLSSHTIFYGDATLGEEAGSFISRNQEAVWQAQAELQRALGSRSAKVRIGNDV